MPGDEVVMGILARDDISLKSKPFAEFDTLLISTGYSDKEYSKGKILSMKQPTKVCDYPEGPMRGGATGGFLDRNTPIICGGHGENKEVLNTCVGKVKSYGCLSSPTLWNCL